MIEDYKLLMLNEWCRIIVVGGKIEFCGCWRVIADYSYKFVRAVLVVSRSFGDIDFK